MLDPGTNLECKVFMFHEKMKVASREQIKILLVDDEQFIVSVLEQFLKKRGYDVTATASPLNALSLIDTEQFDVVITDLKMHPVSGIDILKRLKDSGFEGRTLVMSAYPQKYEDDLRRLRVDFVLEKPFKLDLFFAMVKKLTERQLSNVCGEEGA
jgi:DNA-binding NtrC family response regulator